MNLPELKSLLIVVFEDLDPSNFQNVIIAILAIFIPFALVFLSGILNSKQKRNDFQKLVLNDEVFKTKTTFLIAISSLIFFSFFTGTELTTIKKIFCLLVLFLVIYFFWIALKNILKFSKGDSSDFEISYLKSLTLSKFLKERNKKEVKTMHVAWSSFWAEKLIKNERDYTNIFILHIDKAFDYKVRPEFIIQIAETYQNNLKDRDLFSMGHLVLPKVLQWNNSFINWDLKCREEYKQKKEKKKHLITKAFGLINCITRKNNEDLFFHNWTYFQRIFLVNLVEVLIKFQNGSYQLFRKFEEHINNLKKEVDEEYDKKIIRQKLQIIEHVFYDFMISVFNNYDKRTFGYLTFKNDLPADWKISSINTENFFSHLMLKNFLEWSQSKNFIKNDDSGRDEKLTDIINGVFENVDSELFSVFLILYSSNSVKSVIVSQPNFRVRGSRIAGYVGEDIESQLAELNESKREETITIIIKYFARYWHVLQASQSDLSEEDLFNWMDYSRGVRKEVINEIRKKNLKKLKEEINSSEIISISEQSEYFQSRRNLLIELIDRLISSC